MLSPLSTALAASSDGGGSDGITFMSVSRMPGSGSTMVGSSPGCQRSMLESEPPSDEFPKNRLAVLTSKLSCDGSIAPGAVFISSSGWASSDIETSYCASGGALSASCNSGSSEVSAADGAAAVFAPATKLLEDAGLSNGGDLSPVAALCGGTADCATRPSPFSVRATLRD